MHDILDVVSLWMESGQSTSIAVILKTWGSAPRKQGAHMAISESGEITGSVSGGCVESAVIDAALDVIKTGKAKILNFKVSDENAWDVGLACGGEIELVVIPINSDQVKEIRDFIGENKPFSYSIVLSKGKQFGKLQVIPYEETHNRPVYQSNKIFINPIYPNIKLIIIGGNHIAIALSGMAKILNMRVYIIDPRKVFANSDRFPMADAIIADWPDITLDKIGLEKSSAVVTLSHDPKIDDPALITALNSEAFYIGALGSKSTNTKRMARLEKQGQDKENLSRIHAPIGLNINANTPEEIALSILSEIIQLKNTPG